MYKYRFYIEEAESRGIPIRLNKYFFMSIGIMEQIKADTSHCYKRNKSIGVELACDKEDTKYLLEQAEVDVPRGDIIVVKVV